MNAKDDLVYWELVVNKLNYKLKELQKKFDFANENLERIKNLPTNKAELAQEDLEKLGQLNEDLNHILK